MATLNSDTSEPSPSLGEEIASSVSHGVGLVVALVAGPLLIARAAHHNLPWGTISATVFVTTIWVLYFASTLYHALPPGTAKRVFRRMEHGAIFLLIAGTYTPFTLVCLRGRWGWTIFGLVWLLCVLGILLKLVTTTKHRWLPGVLYLTMAWLIIVAIGPLSTHISRAGLIWLLGGGIAYTVGMAFFAARYVPYCHFVWHLFVMVGTTCHFVAVWVYVI
ncbi:MAG TPA: hemolysin III family protein [Pirellulaceae bacterium]|nr:hemolysin III family protein [Pirellulaceae bacterium]